MPAPHENPPKEYGQWAGNPRGQRADEAKCIEAVWPKDGWIPYQCQRKRGHGPQGMYCRQHAKRYAE